MVETGEEEELRRKLTRDVNCLYDPDRNTRRRALTKIKKVIVEDRTKDGTSPEAISLFFRKQLQVALVTSMSDAVEKCREMSLSIMKSLAQGGILGEQDMAPLIREVVPVMRARVGVAPFVEPTEEIRLLMIQLLNTMLENEGSWHAITEAQSELFPDIAAIVARELADSFPDVKREVGTTISILARRAPSKLRLHQNPILQALIVNLGHQHSKVRQVSLQALGHLFSVGNDAMERLMQEVILPALKKIVFDRTPALRKQLVGVVSGWLRQEDNYFKTTEADLLLVLLLGLSDDALEVQEATNVELEVVGSFWVSRREGEEEEEDPAAAELAVERSNANEKGIQAMTRMLLPSLVPKVLDDIGHWTLRMRHRSILLLASLISFAGPSMVAFLPSIVSSLGAATSDDEVDVLLAVDRAGKSLGAVLEPSALLDEILPRIRGERAGHATAAHRAAALTLLRSLLGGVPRPAAGGSSALTSTQIESVAASLNDAGILEAEGIEAIVLAQPFGEVIIALLQAGPEHCSEVIVQFLLLRAALQLLTLPEGAQPRALAMDACVQLASLAGIGSDAEAVQVLLSRHFGNLLKHISSGAQGWRKDSPSRQAFDALVREGQVGASKYLPSILTLFSSQSDPGKEAELRLAHMLLLETLIGSVACREALPGQSQVILQDIIMPNAVWKAGRVASTIRKVALVCLYNLLKEDHMVPAQVLYQTVPPLLPILKTDLEDYDASSRHLVALSLERIFLALPGAFDEEPVRQLHPELLKRLDDASDDVRKAACGAIAAFLGVARPEIFQGGILDYMADQLFVHLDDSDPAIQEAVLRVLLRALPLDVKLIEKKAQAARGSHRSPRMCDTILEAIKQNRSS